ncbi:hypothetical protein FTO74_16990 [Granulicella sp. WH15]|uniref:hypothetical protein n=1 Tax=Granulicella sp. WH15 TaxID=2602070 RepID=UPI0013671B3B|nr:hypothetical protein [Granulicella sp. WH15]QHN04866.1 hypothetical protein FTO74_16990 [Granulicella sp. WH15]
MTRPNRRPLLHLLTVCLLALAAARLIAQAPSFAGDYTGSPAKPGGPAAPTLHVVQTGSKIEITRTDRGKVSTSRFILNGPEGTYTSPAGLPGKGQAKTQDKFLLIQSVVENKPQPSSPSVQVRIRERWQLTPDRKSLKIDFAVDFPNMAGAPPQSWTEEFTRTARP